MPPKKDTGSKKAEQKKKEKIIEDKTFGLKNKKGAKTQKYVQQVTNQVSIGSFKKNLIISLQIYIINDVSKSGTALFGCL